MVMRRMIPRAADRTASSRSVAWQQGLGDLDDAGGSVGDAIW
jgi:hypothetical protein